MTFPARKGLFPPTLRWALAHPANRGRAGTVLRRYVWHNIRRRLASERSLTVPLGEGLLTGPIDHAVMNLTYYVDGGRYDHIAFRALDALLPAGATFIDVGASLGAYSVLGSHAVGPRGRVIAIEPDAADAKYLVRNLRQGPAPWELLREPLADHERSLVLAGAGTTRHLSLGTHGHEVRTTTLDSLIRNLSVPVQTCFVKVDVEGWEPAVLVGAQDAVKEGLLGILLEANGLQYRSPREWREAVSLLKRCGYRLVWPDPETWSVVEFEDPPCRSPFDNYMALPDAAIAALTQIFGPVRSSTPSSLTNPVS